MQLLERYPHLLAILRFQRIRRVNEEQAHVSVLPGIDLLDALQGAKMSLPLAEAGVADLSGDEDLFTWQSALLQRSTNLFLILIELRGVNVAISGAYSAEACLRIVVPVNLVDS